MGPQTQTIAVGTVAQGAQTSAVRQVLSDPGTFGSVLLVWALDHFGPDFWNLTPTTIAMDTAEDTGVKLTPHALGRLMAARTIVQTDYFFQSLPRFITLANTLSGDAIDDEFDPADPSECAWAITEALLLDPPEPGQEKFCDEIRHYLAEILKEYGFVTPPDVLRLAIGADLSAKVRYNFGDDPEMFSAIHQTQQSKTDEINAMIREGLEALVAQLKVLPLKEGSVVELEKRVAQIQRSADTARSNAERM